MIDISLENDIFINDNIHKFIQEIDVVFNTRLTDVIGDYSFGSDFERFLWSLKDNTDEITEYMKRLISENCPTHHYIDWDAGCTYLEDEAGNNYYFMAIVISDNNGESITRSYIMHDYSKETPIIKSEHL